jgi:C4-type Zn-finger protein
MELEESKRKCISDFYREEFLRHKSRLECQRTFFGEGTYEEIEGVLNRIIAEIDRICEVDNFQELASHLLQRIDVVTNLSSSKVDPTYRIH